MRATGKSNPPLEQAGRVVDAQGLSAVERRKISESLAEASVRASAAHVFVKNKKNVKSLDMSLMSFMSSHVFACLFTG